MAMIHFNHQHHVRQTFGITDDSDAQLSMAAPAKA